MDRSTPPIQYAPRNCSRSNVVSLFMSSKESHAVFTVSRTLNSLHRTPESSFRFCFARSTFAVRSSVFLMLPNAGLAFAHAAGSVHGHRADADGWSWSDADRPSSRPVGEHRQIPYPASHEAGGQMPGLWKGYLSGSGPEAEKILLGPLP